MAQTRLLLFKFGLNHTIANIRNCRNWKFLSKLLEWTFCLDIPLTMDSRGPRNPFVCHEIHFEVFLNFLVLLMCAMDELLYNSEIPQNSPHTYQRKHSPSHCSWYTLILQWYLPITMKYRTITMVYLTMVYFNLPHHNQERPTKNLILLSCHISSL
jgi:hypothetical protein